MSRNKGLTFYGLLGLSVVGSVFVLVWGIRISIQAQDDTMDIISAKRDPFIPLVTTEGRLLQLEHKEETIKGLALEGIIFDKHGISYAVVNGEIVKTGDSIGEYRVLKIEDRKVIFIKDGEPLEVQLNSDM